MKQKHPDAVLLFRVGDFYECYNEDAVAASDILGIVLTRQWVGNTSVQLAGFPHHALDTYLPRLVRAGRRCAICEQLEAPRKFVKRGVQAPARKRLLTTQHSYTSQEQFDKYLAMYESIGYKRLNGGRVPKGTKHKLRLRYGCFQTTLYHE